MYQNRLVLLLLSLAGLLGCSSGDDFSTVACSAGATQACVCDDGNNGHQVCNAKGTAWGDCVCAASASAGGWGGSPAMGGVCKTDDDCRDGKIPYCVNAVCAAPMIVLPGESCVAHGTECSPGSHCSENGNCVL